MRICVGFFLYMIKDTRFLGEMQEGSFSFFFSRCPHGAVATAYDADLLFSLWEFAIFHMISPFHHRFITAYPSFFVKSAMASDILICCGQTASQLRHPMHALGRLSSGMAANAMGAMNPPLVKECSLYRESREGISSPMGQWLTQ